MPERAPDFVYTIYIAAEPDYWFFRVRALNGAGFNILSIKDTTPIPHNGCRPRRARRV